MKKAILAFTLLFSVNSLATVRVNVTTARDGSYYVDFNSQPEADKFISAQIRDGLFGKPGTYSYTSTDITQLQSDLNAAKASVDSFLSKPNPTQADAVAALKALVRLHLQK